MGQVAVKAMRGILFCWMKQTDKLERFKTNHTHFLCAQASCIRRGLRRASRRLWPHPISHSEARRREVVDGRVADEAPALILFNAGECDVRGGGHVGDV